MEGLGSTSDELRGESNLNGTGIREVQTVVVPFLGLEIEVDPMHVVHIILALAAGITIGNFFDWLTRQ